jgi:hypothetical protein
MLPPQHLQCENAIRNTAPAMLPATHPQNLHLPQLTPHPLQLLQVAPQRPAMQAAPPAVRYLQS